MLDKGVDINTENNRACIIGAGPAGLSLARFFKKLHIDYDQFERHSDVGGIWDMNNLGSPIYESAHFISSKYESGFLNYKMPDDYPDYPSHKEVLKYIKDFAKNQSLLANIQFNTQVTKVHWDEESQQWNVELGNGKQQQYRWLISCVGTTWHPNLPEFKGDFNGDIIHSSQYKNSDLFKGKKALVIGAGNSGVDIACDAAHRAEKAYISLRRGYHFIPKYLFGKPADVLVKGVKFFPIAIDQILFSGLLRLFQGDLQRLGLPKPDHKIFETHPILNDQLLHYLVHGDVHVCADIDYFEDNKVYFKDGKSIEVDIIVAATGYHWKLPFLENHIISWDNNRPELIVNMFTKQHPTLFVHSCLETNSGAFALFDYMSYAISLAILQQQKSMSIWQQSLETIEKKYNDNSGGVHYLKLERNTLYVHSTSYKKTLKKIHQHLSDKKPIESIV